MPEGNSPVRYVLYSHYGHGEQEDLAAFTRGVPVAELDGVRHLLAHARGLRELLTAPGHEGLLVLFYAPGYERFLRALANGEDDGKLLSSFDDVECRPLAFAKAVADFVQDELDAQGIGDRVRFLTSFDLRVVLGRVNAILTQQFAEFFVGPAKGIRYDAPKVPEAILRLRVLGNGVPVLRLDHDVIFRSTNKDIGDLGMFKAVACAVRAYQLRQSDPTVSTFLFSASYNSRALLYPSDAMDAFEAWSRAFATRVYPALVADPRSVRSICQMPVSTAAEKSDKARRWSEYVTKYIDEDLAREFYGISLEPGKVAVLGESGLTSIGAHPLYGVISGALLCLSEGAILDLPPFSNLRFNVMWIDDHLKYSLHRAMRHFTSGETLDLEPGVSEARLDDVSVTKARPSVDNLPSYIFENYLPTLLWGAVFDAWITNDPVMKFRVASLNLSKQDHWREARSRQQEACLPKALLEVLRIGRFERDVERRLEKELESTALKRVDEVRLQWARLKNDRHSTFAYHWAIGDVRESFGEECFVGCPDNLWQGIAPGRAVDRPLTSVEDLSPAVMRKLLELIKDAVAYVHWTLEWPRFVQIVRSITQGTFRGDITWTEPNEDERRLTRRR